MVMMVYLFIATAPVMAAKLTTMVYLFHLHDSVVMLYTPRWFTFSIYAIETHDLKTWTLSSTFSPASTSFFSEEE